MRREHSYKKKNVSLYIDIHAIKKVCVIQQRCHQTRMGARKLAIVFDRKVISVDSNPEKWPEHTIYNDRPLASVLKFS